MNKYCLDKIKTLLLILTVVTSLTAPAITLAEETETRNSLTEYQKTLKEYQTLKSSYQAAKDQVERTSKSYDLLKTETNLMFWYFSAWREQIQAASYLAEATKNSFVNNLNSFEESAKNILGQIENFKTFEKSQEKLQEIAGLMLQARAIIQETKGLEVVSRLNLIIQEFKTVEQDLADQTNTLPDQFTEKAEIQATLEQITSDLINLEKLSQEGSSLFATIEKERTNSLVLFTEGKKKITESRIAAIRLLDTFKKAYNKLRIVKKKIS